MMLMSLLLFKVHKMDVLKISNFPDDGSLYNYTNSSSLLSFVMF